MGNFFKNTTSIREPEKKKTSYVDSIKPRRRFIDRRKVVQSIQSKLDERRTLTEKLADNLTRWFGSFWFVALNFFVFVAWIFLNSNIVPGIIPFDPFPFIFLTMTVSLEAIFLAVFILMSQNREAKIKDLREEIDLHVNIIAEQEITKLMHLLAVLMKHMKVPYENDTELQRMMKPLDTEDIRAELEQELNLTPEKAADVKKIS